MKSEPSTEVKAYGLADVAQRKALGRAQKVNATCSCSRCAAHGRSLRLIRAALARARPDPHPSSARPPSVTSPTPSPMDPQLLASVSSARLLLRRSARYRPYA